jgi:hypothetical protein
VHGVVPLADDDINGKRVAFHVFDLSGSTAAYLMIVDAADTPYSSPDDVNVFRKVEH